MNPVVHFELPYRDRPRAERFYATAFGWKSQFLVGRPRMIPHYGRSVSFVDTEGTRIGMLGPISA